MCTGEKSEIRAWSNRIPCLNESFLLLAFLQKIPKEKGKQGEIMKTRRNCTLLSPHHQYNRAMKNYEITLQSHMRHLQERNIRTKENNLPFSPLGSDWDLEKNKQSQPKRHQTHTIIVSYIRIGKGYVCSFSTSIHVIFLKRDTCQVFELFMIFLSNLFVEVEL